MVTTRSNTRKRPIPPDVEPAEDPPSSPDMPLNNALPSIASTRPTSKSIKTSSNKQTTQKQPASGTSTSAHVGSMSATNPPATSALDQHHGSRNGMQAGGEGSAGTGVDRERKESLQGGVTGTGGMRQADESSGSEREGSRSQKNDLDVKPINLDQILHQDHRLPPSKTQTPPDSAHPISAPSTASTQQSPIPPSDSRPPKKRKIELKEMLADMRSTSGGDAEVGVGVVGEGYAGEGRGVNGAEWWRNDNGAIPASGTRTIDIPAPPTTAPPLFPSTACRPAGTIPSKTNTPQTGIQIKSEPMDFDQPPTPTVTTPWKSGHKQDVVSVKTEDVGVEAVMRMQVDKPTTPHVPVIDITGGRSSSQVTPATSNAKTTSNPAYPTVKARIPVQAQKSLEEGELRDDDVQVVDVRMTSSTQKTQEQTARSIQRQVKEQGNASAESVQNQRNQAASIENGGDQSRPAQSQTPSTQGRKADHPPQIKAKMTGPKQTITDASAQNRQPSEDDRRIRNPTDRGRTRSRSTARRGRSPSRSPGRERQRRSGRSRSPARRGRSRSPSRERDYRRSRSRSREYHGRARSRSPSYRRYGSRSRSRGWDRYGERRRSRSPRRTASPRNAGRYNEDHHPYGRYGSQAAPVRRDRVPYADLYNGLPDRPVLRMDRVRPPPERPTLPPYQPPTQQRRQNPTSDIQAGNDIGRAVNQASASDTRNAATPQSATTINPGRAAMIATTAAAIQAQPVAATQKNAAAVQTGSNAIKMNVATVQSALPTKPPQAGQQGSDSGVKTPATRQRSKQAARATIIDRSLKWRSVNKWFRYWRPLKAASTDQAQCNISRQAWKSGFARIAKKYRPELAAVLEELNYDGAGPLIKLEGSILDFVHTPLGHWLAFYLINVDTLSTPPGLNPHANLTGAEFCGSCFVTKGTNATCPCQNDAKKAKRRKNIVNADDDLRVYGWILAHLADTSSRKIMASEAPILQDEKVSFMDTAIAVPPYEPAMPFPKRIQEQKEQSEQVEQAAEQEQANVQLEAMTIEIEELKQKLAEKEELQEQMEAARKEVERLQTQIARGSTALEVVEQLHGMMWSVGTQTGE